MITTITTMTPKNANCIIRNINNNNHYTYNNIKDLGDENNCNLQRQ